MTKRFENAKEALYSAFFSGTLAKWNCACCAVGNIVGYSNNCAISKEEFKTLQGNVYHSVFDFFRKVSNRWHSVYAAFELENSYLTGEIDGTGYTGKELSEVELAFEKNTKIIFEQYDRHTEEEILEDQYNGLSAVFDVLLRLDGEDSVDDYRSKLRTHPKLQAVDED